MLQRLLDYLYPPLCALCEQSLPEACPAEGFPADGFPAEGPSHLLLCQGCNRLERYLTSAASPGLRICTQCGERLLPREDGPTCALCSAIPLEPDELRSLFFYSHEVEQVLKRYKYGRLRALGRPLGKLLAAFVAAEPFSANFHKCYPDVVVPIPSSRESLMRRGFNHLAPIAAEIGRQIRRPVLLFALRSQGKRMPQALLSPTSGGARLRAQNIEGGFRAERARVEGKSILLVDDIATTGASMRECARALRAAGAAHVFGVTIARSNLFSRHRLLSVLSSPKLPGSAQ